MAELTGKEIVCKVLEAEGVEHVFGNPGSTEIPLLDTLLRYPGVRYVLALHEGAGMAMADGLARASGKPSFVNVHATGGTANLVGMLSNAKIDGVPLVVTAGQQDSRMLIREPFLASNIVDMVAQYCKWSWEVRRIEELPIALRRAFKVATSPPMGPVFLSLAKNVLEEKLEVEIAPVEQNRVAERVRGDVDAIRKAAEIIVGAEEPIVVAGRSVAQAGATRELVSLAEMLGARVYADPGTYPTAHALHFNTAEDASRNPSLFREADVVIAVGQRLFAEVNYSPAPTFAPNTKVVQLDADSWQIAKNFPVSAAIVADPKAGLQELIAAMREMMDARKLEHNEARLARNKAAKAAMMEAMEQKARAMWDSVPIHPFRLVGEMQNVLPPDSVLVEDSPTMGRFLKRYFRFGEGHDCLMTHGGALGWGLGAAVGAKMALAERPVVAFAGDGAAMYAPQALWTAARHGVAAVFVIANNSGYGAVRGMLTRYDGEAARTGNLVGAEIGHLNFALLAESMGIHGERVERPERIAPALTEALASGQPSLVEVMLEPEDGGLL